MSELIDVVRLADDLGFRGCYSADETYHKDMWILFGAAARETRHIRFGPEVSGVILRDPTPELVERHGIDYADLDRR